MESPKTTDFYDFPLPKELVAQFPLPNRTDARLMVVHRQTGEIEHHHIRELPEILQPGDLLVQNDSRVIPAKLMGYREKTGGRWQGLFLEQDEAGLWRLLAKTRGKVQPGERVVLLDREAREYCHLTLLAQLGDASWAAKPSLDLPVWELLDLVGRVPLPHYIRGGNMVDTDWTDYQTVYAAERGSIAAPTAGLHFTPSLLQVLDNKRIDRCAVTLHVGVGTFRPIQVDDLSEHRMHSEWGEVDLSAATEFNRVRQRGGRVIAVGTTVVRLLETAIRNSPAPVSTARRDWERPVNPSEATAEETLPELATQPELSSWRGATDLFIHPPFTFHAVDSLLTNFHLPRSTLLVLVSTFGGHELIRRAYAIAMEERYRFFSYGDAMLIL